MLLSRLMAVTTEQAKGMVSATMPSSPRLWQINDRRSRAYSSHQSTAATACLFNARYSYLELPNGQLLSCLRHSPQPTWEGLHGIVSKAAKLQQWLHLTTRHTMPCWPTCWDFSQEFAERWEPQQITDVQICWGRLQIQYCC